MRYIIGIDLGTTNSSVAYIDTYRPPLALQLFPIPQFTALGRIEALLTLPSFCYLIAKEEWPPGVFTLPWKEETFTFVGQFAKIQGARIPTRLVQSAKSWLCNVAANRKDKILPIEASDTTQRISPVEASAKYLLHIKEAWNATLAKGDPEQQFEEQELILTVPASFDEVARSLTVEAARLAGFSHMTLLEEPQAAFYSWIAMHEEKWRDLLKAGDSILVCDVGGGTTDFSLIEVHTKEDNSLVFQRMAVGEHLLLGGDNIDETVAHYLEQRIQQQKSLVLESSQWLQLRSEARLAKEELLGSVDSHTVVLQGSGSSVIEGSVAINIKRAEIEQLLLKGFFCQYELSEALQLSRKRGLRTMGLPYEDEPSITKHLAHFLQQAHYLEKGVDYVLFNGGTMKPLSFQQAIYQSLCRWFPHKTPTMLASAGLDLAVARGAAYYGKARRGLGVAIGGGLPRTYYLKVDVKNEVGQFVHKALTVLPRGAEEGATFQSELNFMLRPNTPIVFHLLTSHVRLHDKPGDLVAIDEQEIQPLPPIQTILRFGRKHVTTDNQETIPVSLGLKLTAIGTLELWLQSKKTEHRWNLEFQLRAASGQDDSLLSNAARQRDETLEDRDVQEAKQMIESLFVLTSTIKPSQIMEKLEERLACSRRDWSPSLLRGLGDSLLKVAGHRRLSLEHESRWWNLAGFFLRPGFGFPLDDFRVREMWKIILNDSKMAKNPECQIQKWICYRRLAGGLNQGQQMQIANELIATLLNKKTGKIEIKGKSELYAYSEKIRALAALERIDLSLKIKLAEALLMRIKQKEAGASDYWALARIGARHLVYGSVGQVVPKEICGKWVEQLLQIKDQDVEPFNFVIGQLGRKTDHRELNLSDSIMNQILKLDLHDSLKDLLLHSRALTALEQEQVFGDRLPVGLMLEM